MPLFLKLCLSQRNLFWIKNSLSKYSLEIFTIVSFTWLLNICVNQMMSPSASANDVRVLIMRTYAHVQISVTIN